jgi:hypothetical protein
VLDDDEQMKTAAGLKSLPPHAPLAEGRVGDNRSRLVHTLI